jgi:hypothetical protein
MANAFYREIINLLERPVSTDINQAQSMVHRSLMLVLQEMLRGRASESDDSFTLPASGFLGDAFRLRPSSPTSMVLRLVPGLGVLYLPADTPTAINGVTGLDDLSVTKPVLLAADQLITVPTADPSNPRIDILEVKLNRVVGGSEVRGVFNVATKVFDPTLVSKLLGYTLDGSLTINGSGALNYKTGSPNVSPSPPATDAGYIKIAEVRVGTGVTALDLDVVNDQRIMVWPGSQAQVGANFVMQGTGSLKPANMYVNAPPGMNVLTVGQNLTGQVVDVYIMSGGNSMKGSFSLMAELASFTGPVRAWMSNYGVVTVDSALQTALAGANANPTAKVAIGQKLYKATVNSLPADSGTNSVHYVLNVNMRI